MFHNYLPVSEDAVRLTRPPTTQYVQSSEADRNGVQKRQQTITHHMLHSADCFRPGNIFIFCFNILWKRVGSYQKKFELVKTMFSLILTLANKIKKHI